MPAPPTSAEELSGTWSRQERYWHAAFAMIWLASVVVTVLANPGPHGRWPELAILIVIGIAYAVCGVRGLRGEESGHWGQAYLAITWGGIVLAQMVNPNTQTWLLYFVTFAHLWVMLSRRAAIIATIGLSLGLALIRFLESDRSSGAITAITLSGVLSLAPALVLGLFIDRMVEEARSRAETIDALRAAQTSLAAVERDRGVLEERERMAREIHDTLAQGFTSVLALSRAADAALGRGDVDTARERLALLGRTAQDNLSEARLIVAETTPGHLQSRTLGEALERLGAAVSQESRIVVEVAILGDPVPLGGVGEVVLLRTAQEALANVRKHSGASTSHLTLDYRDRAGVRLAIEDDGHGFDELSPRGGFGLDGIRARAAEIGGVAMIGSVAGSGTTVTVEVPR